jgi:hypothetical protein
MGGVAWELGEIWEAVGEKTTQAHLLDHILRGGLNQSLPDNVTEATLRNTEARLEAAMSRLPAARMSLADGSLITDEFESNARLARYACRLGIALRRGEADRPVVRRALADEMREIISERPRLWLARNREGGLEDSLDKLKELTLFF